MGKFLSALLAAILIINPALAAVTNADRALVERGQNGMTNGGFESGKSGWVASAGTFTTTTAAGNVDSGTTAGSWAASGASGRTLDYSMTITAGGAFSGQNGAASCKFKAASGTATHTLSVVDGSGNNLGNVVTLNSSTSTFMRTTSNFVFPSSGTVKLRITTVSASEPQIYPDTCYFGTAEGFNLIQVSQAQLLGTIKITGCSTPWAWSSTSLSSAGAATGCTYTTTGQALAPSTNLPAIKFASVSPGDYILKYEGSAQSATAAKSAYFQFTDGTNTARELSIIYPGTTSGAGGVVIPGFQQTMTYTQGQGATTFEIFAKVDSGGSADIYGQTAQPGVISVYYYPSQSSLATSSNQPIYPTIQKFTSGSGTYTRPANVSYIRVRMVGAGGGGSGGGTTGTAGTGGTGGDTTFGGITAGGATGVTGGAVTPGSGAIGTFVAGSQGGGNTQEATGTHHCTGSVGASSPFSGAGAGQNQGAGIAAVANTGSGGGGGGANSATACEGGRGGGTGAYVDAIITNPSVTYSYAIGAAGSAGTAGTSGSAGGAGGSGYIEVTEYYGSQAPITIGSVTSGYSGAQRVEWADFVCGTTSSIISQSGVFTSITNGASGVCTLNYPATTWTTAPHCVVSTYGGTARAVSMNGFPSTTAASITSRNTNLNIQNDNDNQSILCVGPR